MAEVNDSLEDEEIINKQSGVMGSAYCAGFGHRIGERPKREHLKSIATSGSRKIVTTAGAGWRRKHHFGFIIIYKNCFAQDIYACFVVAFVWFVYIITVNKMPFFLCPLVKFLWRGSFP